MLMLSFLLVSSPVWGGLIWLVARALQRSNVPGRARQWIWRGATVLLLAPWVSAPLVFAFGWGLAPNPARSVDEILPATFMVEPSAFAQVAETVGVVMADAPVAIDPVQVILLVLAAGWLARFVIAQLAARSLLGVTQYAREAGPGLARNSLNIWGRRLGMRRPPRLLVVAETVSPFSFGVLRPTICLPEGLEQRLKAEALDMVIAHECTHVARGDGWLRPLERITADILWFNPFAWLMRRELDVARELACDEAVIEMARDRKVYAQTLRDVAGFTVCLPAAVPAASMSLAGESLMLRVTRTLSVANRKPARVAIASACMLALVAAPLAVAQVMLVTPAPEAPPAPQPPEPPAAAIYTSDGTVRVSFPATVAEIGGGAAQGYTLRLEGSGDGSDCIAHMKGLGSILVVQGQAIERGDVVGARPASGSMTFEVNCANGGDHAAMPAPPAPPAYPRAAAAAGRVVPAPAGAVAVTPRPAAAPPAPLLSAPLMPTPLWPPAAVAPVPAVPPANAPDAPAPPAPPPSPAGAPDAPAPPHRIANAPHAVVVAPARVTSGFGERKDPLGDGRVNHAGIDVASKRGTAIHAPGEGVVAFAGNASGYGNMVEIATGGGYQLRFAQLEEIKVRQGQTVAAGTVIGTMGSSGPRATGPHLHLEVHKDGRAVNPAVVNGLVVIGN